MKIIDKIIDKQKEKFSIEIDEKGYIKSSNPIDNLISDDVKKNWDEIKVEIEKGQGNELKVGSDKRIKFCALHSSSALCINNFAIYKNNQSLSFLNNSEFKEVKYEEKIKTGISTPNLDIYLENSNVIIGVESKFTEYFTANFEHTKENLSKYFMREELDYLPRLFDSVILHYINCNEKMYLNVAQLIKHAIGLINLNKKNNKEIILVYIYWEPKSWEINSPYQEIHERHKNELEVFEKLISKFIKFKHLTYSDFWAVGRKNKLMEEHIKLVEERYNFEI